MISAPLRPSPRQKSPPTWMVAFSSPRCCIVPLLRSVCWQNNSGWCHSEDMANLNDEARLAVLIDADNAHAKYLEPLLVEIAKYGTASVRRAYGDWTSTRLAKWKSELLTHSVQPMQQFSYTTGKNATDSALIIDAMDLLHSGTVDGFCLVSSDSDFTRLAARIREQGLIVYGLGEKKKTPKPFVAACTTFIYVENLGDTEAAPEPTPTPALIKDPVLDKVLAEAVRASIGDDGWAILSAVGSNLARLKSDFDTRSWGFAKLKDLMEAHPTYQVKARSMGEGRQPSTYVRRAP